MKEVSADALCNQMELLEKNRLEVRRKSAECVECVREYYDEKDMLDAFEQLYQKETAVERQVR